MAEAETQQSQPTLRTSIDWKGRLIDEAFRQGPVFVILLLMIGMIGYLGYYSITVAVPDHLKSIKDGYKEVSVQMEKSVDKMAATWEKDSARDEVASKAILSKLDEINSTRRTAAKGSPIIHADQ